MRRALLALLALMPQGAAASAWMQEPGHGLLIVSAAQYDAKRFFDFRGSSQKQAQYQRREISPYFEYGLSDGWTVGGKTFLQRASLGAQKNDGIGETEVFVRRRVWDQAGLAMAIEPMVKLPSPDSRRDAPLLSSPSPDIGRGGNVGYGFSGAGKSHFVNMDTQYRHRMGRQRDQVRLSLTAGIGLTPDFQLMPQLFHTRRVAAKGASQFTRSASDDYDQTQLQLSGVMRVTQTVRVQLGAYADVAGKNTTKGYGVLGAVWTSF